jgi:hypothetical protein
MKPSVLFLCIAISAFASTSALAGASGVSFSRDEIDANLANSAIISETAANCLARTYDKHLRFHRLRGYSKFYGNRRKDYKTPQGRKDALLKLLPDLAARVKRGDKAAINELNMREKELENTSCVGLALQCLGEGFAAAKMDDTWRKIYRWLGREGEDGSPLFYGTDLQKALVDLGWKALYWNPDLSQNQEWDRLERAFTSPKDGKEWAPVWGGHALRWSSVLRQKNYYEIPIHDIQTLVNFGVRPPEEFKMAPFFVGTAHAGYHVFPGYRGQVIEAHSMRSLAGIDNIEVGPFNPLDQPINGVANGTGAPKWTRSEHYRSGVIVVPAGYISEKPYTTPRPAIGTPPNGTKPPKRDDSRDRERERERDRDRNRDRDCDWWRFWC